MIVPRTPIERLLAERHRGVAIGLGGADDVEAAHDLLNVLDAGRALAGTEVEAWRRRFERVALGPWGVPVREPAVRARARRHLERLAAAVEAERDPERQHAARLVASGVPRGLAATGVLSERDADAFHDRLYGSPRAGTGPDEHEPGVRPGADAFVDLVRVLPGPDVRRAGFRVTFVELFAGGVQLAWQHVAEGRGQPRWQRRGSDTARLFALGDDLGTPYESAGGGWSGGGEVTTGEAGFTPAPPPEARMLTVTVEGGTLEVGLTP